MIASATPDQADEHTAAVIRLVQSSLFEAMLKVREAADADPVEQMKLLSQAAQAVAQVGRASIAQKRWQDEVRDNRWGAPALRKNAGRMRCAISWMRWNARRARAASGWMPTRSRRCGSRCMGEVEFAPTGGMQP